jgi:hypothetical protein
MNLDGFFITGIVFVLVYSVFIFLYKNENSEKKETLDYNEMENTFFQKTKGENFAYKLLRIYNPFDLMMIKSFFISENIPYYVEFEHFMKIYPFVHSANYNNANIYILDEDYDDAVLVINSYIKNKNLNEYKIKYAFRGVFEYLFMNWVVTSPQNYLGMEVNYKK